jgi:hypothetical protein
VHDAQELLAVVVLSVQVVGHADLAVVVPSVQVVGQAALAVVVPSVQLVGQLVLAVVVPSVQVVGHDDAVVVVPSVQVVVVVGVGTGVRCGCGCDPGWEDEPVPDGTETQLLVPMPTVFPGTPDGQGPELPVVLVVPDEAFGEVEVLLHV